MSVLELQAISKRYSKSAEEAVLQDLWLQVDVGEVVVVIGPSGCGKSTMLQVAGLMDAADSGRVLLMGRECSFDDDRLATKMRQRHLGFIYQFHHLLPEFTVMENLMIPRMIAGRSVTRDWVMSYLERVGLESKANAFVTELSGGEQQRVAIIRSVINDPVLIIADEPTGNLDAANAEAAYSLLLEEVRNNNRSLLMVTHNIELVRGTADRIMVLCDGCLEAYKEKV